MPDIVVYVRLFADLIWLVHFERIALTWDDCAPYRIELADGSERLGD